MTVHATLHDLRNASVFLTGGGSGIGTDLTDGVLAQGARVAFIGCSDAAASVDEKAARHGNVPLFIQGGITAKIGPRQRAWPLIRTDNV